MHLYYLFTVFIFLAAVFSYINYRFLRWPAPIAVMTISLLASLILLGLKSFFPDITAIVGKSVRSISFYDMLMKVFLGFILFAGAYRIKLAQLIKYIKPVIALALLATLLSTFIAGSLVFLLLQVLKINIPLIYCLLFGSLISPTDPVAVLGILRKMGIPASIEMKVTGEAIFNDGVAIVIFTLLYSAAAEHGKITLAGGIMDFFKETGGGIVWGALLAGIGFLALKPINSYKVEILITVVLVMCGYAIADQIQVSGPIAMVIAGLITGSLSKKSNPSDESKKYVTGFWELTEDFFNLILFLMIGLEVLVIPFNKMIYFIGCAAIILVLTARFLSVFAMTKLFKSWFEERSAMLLTWCGLRGGISIALALSLPAGMPRSYFVIFTYLIVVFSIIVQGLTIKKFIRHVDPG